MDSNKAPSLLDRLSIIAGKLSVLGIRLLGLGLASNLPGRIALNISPGVLTCLSSQVRKGVIAVSGTNGKSTSSGLVASILRQEKLKVIHNRQGANLVAGITSTLVDASSWMGKIDADYCLFEIDEAALPLVAKQIKMQSILVTNLFRDQLDRFGELDTTAKLISKGVLENRSKSILNADDPNVAQMVPDCERIYYGIASLVQPNSAAQIAVQDKGSVAELAYCPGCGQEYEYSLRFYGQIGHYFCQHCGKKRPQPKIYAEDVSVGASGSNFQLIYGNERLTINLPLPGLFNVYNALSAAALCFSIGISGDSVAKGLCAYSTLFGRSERISFNGKNLLIQLIKNPAGASQALQAAAADPEARLFIAINDNYADGRDVSWLWDADFEYLSTVAGTFIVSGQRCHDMAVRLKYAGIASQNIFVETELEKALDKALALLPEDKTLWVLPTYTCLLELQKIMKARGCLLSGT